MQPAPNKKLTGQWHGPTGVIELHPDGTAMANGETAAWFADKDSLTLIGASGVFQWPYQIAADTLTWIVNGQPVSFQRKAAGGPTGRGSPGTDSSLVGEWSYLGGVNTYDGGSSSSACLILKSDGTYESNFEYSSSGNEGIVGAQNADQGHWAATETTLSLQSVNGGSQTYALQKVNHPKNGDPMIVLDGKAYVTRWQKPGWR